MGQLTGLLSQLDSRLSVRGRQFERLCGWYLQNAPEYRGRIRRVWLWSEWPGAWGADAGIDLVAEDRNARLWAIQTKAYAESYAIKKADIDSFLSESSRPQFSYRLLIATTDHLGPTARRTLDAQREPVGYLLRSQLELAQVDWPSSWDDLRPRRPRPKKPLPHVREAIEATVKGFADEQRGQLIMACGTGKTLAAMWIAERLRSNRTLVLVPSLSLLAQTLREWSANTSEPFEYLAVCSDPTVVGEDALVERTAELAFPATTDPSDIASFLRGRGRRVVFATYQSSPQIAIAFEGRTPQFDLAIADEAHRCAGRTSSDFATILDSDQIKSRRRLFMTATPRFYTPRVRSEAGQLDVDIASMDNEAVFGPVLHRLTFGRAIGRDLLSDYQVVVVGVDDEMYRAWAEHGEFVTREGHKVTDARSLAGQIGLAKSMRKYGLRRIISFHGRVKAAREFSAEIPCVIGWMPAHARPPGAIWSEHVSGVMTSGHRDRLLLRFRDLAQDERGLLSNARCLGEGVDVPSIDSVAFIDPRRSTIDIVQALGRAIRKSDDKRLGIIVLPVFVSDNEDPDQVLNDSAFQHVWDVIKALRAHDETLGEELDELRRRLGARRGAHRRPNKIKLDLPRAVDAKFARAFDVRLVEQTTASWEFYFGLLQRFVELHGHALVPQETREDGYRLGSWVNNQRTLRAKGELDPDRERELESVPGWSWDVLQALWDEGFGCLKQFVERKGHARVPVAAREDGYRLGAWVDGQRQSYRQRMLSDERARRLDGLPGWTWTPQESVWEEGFNHLRDFVEREGHARVFQEHRERGFPLGKWVARQRRRKQNGTLSDVRRARLEAMRGWSWDTLETAWEEGFDRLQSYVHREGHALVPSKYKDDGYPLGQWVSIQRGLKRQRKLSDGRARRLEGLPGWTWDPLQGAWDVGFNHLRHFAEREGHTQVPQNHREQEFPLGQWVSVQRLEYRKGTLLDERVQRLESLRGWSWDTLETAWEEGFRHLREFANRERHSRVASSYRDPVGFRLGGWVSEQRQSSRRGTLDPKRRRRLEAMAGWTWSPQESAWEEGFAHLQTYAKREGQTQVPSAYREDGCPLGKWTSHQRQSYRRGTLDPKRRRQLEALPGWTQKPVEDPWEDGFARLQSYVEREGHSRVPQSYLDGDGYRLGGWASNQRRRYQQGVLEEERRRRLEALPSWTWSPLEDAWEDGFARLQTYMEREGHSRVPRSYRDGDGFLLGQWVIHQRQRYQQGALEEERRRRLEALPSWTWDPLEDAWEDGFARLQTYMEREGHSRVPQTYRDGDGFLLGQWVSNRRADHRRGTLDEQRRRRLEALPGWTWNTRARPRETGRAS
jgi:superfamily II DNA or RNA helicase